jgi:hypothetical protein
VTNAPSNLNTIFNGFVLWILEIPFILAFAVLTLAVGIVAVAFMLLDRVYGFAVIGFMAGLRPGWHVHPFGQLADRLGWVGRLLGISAVQAFTIRGARNKVWAIAPVVLGVLAVSLAWLVVVPAMRQHGLLPGSAAAEPIVRYRPTSSWQRDIRFGEWRFELTQVVLAPQQIEATVRCHNMSPGSATLRVDEETRLESYKPGRLGFLHEEQVLSKEYLGLRRSDAPSQGIMVPAQDYRDVTLFFARPETPHQRWGLTFYAGTTAKGGVRVPFIFDLAP